MSVFFFPTRVNEHTARLVATSVSAASVIAVASQNRWLVAFLTLGFLIRVGWGPTLSPTARVASWLAPRLWKPRVVAGAPKRFAQGIGSVLTLTALSLLLIDQTRAAWALIGMLAGFAFLEAAFGFCLGCKIYAGLQRVGVIGPDSCPDCAI